MHVLSQKCLNGKNNCICMKHLTENPVQVHLRNKAWLEDDGKALKYWVCQK